MRLFHYCLSLVGSFALSTLSSSDWQAEKPPEPGLVASYYDTAVTPVVEICRIEPTIAFSLQAGESPHPRIGSRAWTAHWRGQIQVFRSGRYRFSAEVVGRLRVQVAGQTVLLGELADRNERLVGNDVDLPAGTLPFDAEFSRLGSGSALSRVYWESASFSREPVPWSALFHTTYELTESFHRSQRQERGRFLVEELSCTACHQPGGDDSIGRGLKRREGPDLSRIGERAHPGWIDHWLENPQSFRPQAVMPHLFRDDARGRAERYAVTSFLESLGGPIKPQAQNFSRDELNNFRKRGERLFGRIGCSVCHGEPPDSSEQCFASLGPIGSKTIPNRLAQYLQNPAAIDPSGRMPQMRLDGSEARDLAYFLCESRNESLTSQLTPLPDSAAGELRMLIDETQAKVPDRAAFARLSEGEKLRVVGEQLVVERRCANCHRLKLHSHELTMTPAKTDFASLRRSLVTGSGCLRTSGQPSDRAAPWFRISDSERACIEAFLAEACDGPGSVAPAYEAETTVQRFHCTGCHNRAGHGGLGTKQLDELRRYETVQDAESIRPPSLTEVGARLQTPWLRAVLTGGQQSRPWMGLRMPQFGSPQVAQLPEQFAACDGIEPSGAIPEFNYDASHVEAGRLLVGKRGFGCISCHDIAGQPNTGTRGPDLASMNRRVRFDWYTRWLDDPQRMEPGTRMPTVFQNRTTAIKNVLGGDAAAQSQAIWEYLSLGANLPLPEGLERPRGLVLEPRDRTIVIRSFLPDTSPRGIAVGFPAGVSCAFDASQCRLAYAWTGQFLNAGPIWQNRGGSPAGIQGPRFWSAPAGCPWELTNSPAESPNWPIRLTDPARGAPVPHGEISNGLPRIQFRNYSVDRAGIPEFHYQLQGAGDGSQRPSADIQERIRPLQTLAGVGVARSFAIRSDRGVTAWLLVAESSAAPKLVDKRGDLTDVSQTHTSTDYAASGNSLLVSGQTGSSLVVPQTVPADARWIIEAADGQWRVSLRIPLTPTNELSSITIENWSPYRNEPAMIRAILNPGPN